MKNKPNVNFIIQIFHTNQLSIVVEIGLINTNKINKDNKKLKNLVKNNNIN